LTTHVTTDSPEEGLLKIAIDLGMEDVFLLGGDELYLKGNYMVFLNGQIVGIHREPDFLVKSFRLLRKRGRI
jgi:DNA-directed RNA polymerase III subunit RPC2